MFMQKAKSFTKNNLDKKVKLSKTLNAKHSIGIIGKNTDNFILTFGQFSLIDALAVILDQTGPAHVSISTWTAADAHLERSKELLSSLDVLSFRMIVDRSFESRQPGYYYHMIKLFGENSIRAIRTHAKFMIVRNDKYDIVVRTSMNLNENPRLENIEISENKLFANFLQEIVDSVFSEVEKSVNKSNLLDLKNIEEESVYKLVDANQIQRSALNEPETTHTIKK